MLCDPAAFIDIDRGFQIINPFSIAFLRRYLKGDAAMAWYLSAAYAATFPEASLVSAE